MSELSLQEEVVGSGPSAAVESREIWMPGIGQEQGVPTPQKVGHGSRGPDKLM